MIENGHGNDYVKQIVPFNIHAGGWMNKPK